MILRLDLERWVSTCGDNLFKEENSTAGHRSFLYFIYFIHVFFKGPKKYQAPAYKIWTELRANSLQDTHIQTTSEVWLRH